MTAVLLAPHNDDETLFASFLILRYRPKVIVCLRSERMHRPDYPGGPLGVTAKRREGETWQALQALEYLPPGAGAYVDAPFEQWDISDDVIDELRLYNAIWAATRGAELVIFPALERDGNQQHNMVARAVENAVEPERRVPYLTYTAEGRSRHGVEVPFEPHWPARKLAALACYRSQIAHPATAPHFLDGGLREYTTDPLP